MARVDHPRPIVVLTPDLGRNAVGRSLMFADLLRGPGRDVVLAGSTRAGRRWAPLDARRDIEIVELPANPVRAAAAIRERWSGCLIVATKPLLRSFGVALAAATSPIVLDIDDPEIALTLKDIRTLGRAWLSSENPLITGTLQLLRGRAGAVAVASQELRASPADIVVPHARDEGLFTDQIRDRLAARTALGLGANVSLIVFVGTPRAHKGVQDLRDAVTILGPSVRLAVVGATKDAFDDDTIAVPPVPYATALTWVAAADVVAVPQRDTPIGRRQTPAKLTDALAVGRAIVTTPLAPIQEVVGGAGLYAEPANAVDLAEKIRRVLDDPALRLGLERDARARFMSNFSFEMVRPRAERLLALAMAQG